MKRLVVSSKHMGGRWEVQCFPHNKYEREHFNQIIQDGFKEVVRIENLLTDFKPSPFMKINDFAGEKPVKVDQEIFNLIEESLQISKETDGLFDISYATVGHYWRQCKKKGLTPDEKTVAELSEFIDYRTIEIDKEERTVFLPHPFMRIGLGGIGKGYAVDKLFDFLRRKGMVNFMVNGSGDIRVHSLASAPRKWKVGIRNPFNPDPTVNCGLLCIDQGSVATSGDYVNTIKNTQTKSHHIISPMDGQSSKGIVSSTVWTDSAVLSDTMATSLMLMEIHEAIAFSNSRGLFTLLIDESGKVYLSRKAMQVMTQNHLQEEPVCEWH
jgi:thiamine biosynthesis lipoprotein